MRERRVAGRGLMRWRAEREAQLLEDRRSPLHGRRSAEQFHYYPERPDLAVQASVEPLGGESRVRLPLSSGGELEFRAAGRAQFELAGEKHQLTLYAPGSGTHEDHLFLPFMDATSGSETYAAGRYIDVPLAGAGTGLTPTGRITLTLDFNRAYHPLCAHHEAFACPLPPFENRLSAPVRAGERLAHRASASFTGAAQPAYLQGELPVLHGFTTREGGVSSGPFAALNLGLSSGDATERVEENRDLLLAELGFTRERVLAFHQVHGARVLASPASWFKEQADAGMTSDPNTLVVVSAADCLPLLFHHPPTETSGGAPVAAAHAGWRGTRAGIARSVLLNLRERYGAEPGNLTVLLGPSIGGCCYQVGAEVVEEFRAAGFPREVAREDEVPGKYRLDLKAANRWLLEAEGVPRRRIIEVAGCTSCEPRHYYSYRRDGGVTGRQWAFISPAPRERSGA